MTSTGGPEAELRDPRRRELLQALNDALPALETLRPTAWACLWLCDVDKLVELLNLAQTAPTATLSFFDSMEFFARIIPTCRMMKLILPRQIANIT
jgi:hypothetical protein